MSEAPIQLEHARGLVLERVTPLAIEEVGLRQALGRRTAVDVFAEAPVQGFDNSAMDGFAVRAADTVGARPEGPVSLELVAESRAGHPSPLALAPGGAIAISTGAMLPQGADAVIRVEDTRRDGDRVLVEVEVEAGLDVRRAGEDIAAGELVLPAGSLIGAAELGVLASVGRDPVGCHRRPAVAVVTSGDELVPPREPLGPGRIHDTNSYTVPALAEAAGADVVSVAWAPDRPEPIVAALEAAVAADIVLVCGGVSVGEHDHVKGALATLGVEQAFWRVALKPGGPTWFGGRGRTLVFGLPGNPVSAMVTFTLLARPALIALAGGDPAPVRATATLAAPCRKRPGRLHAARCRLELTDAGWLAHPADGQGSHMLSSMLGAECLALLPADSGDLPAGAKVEVEPLAGASIST